MNPIDLVVPWVDSTDPQWQQTYRMYAGTDDSSAFLYRDWGWMRYWFRAAERNLPWIRRIHFITFGYVPSWLNPDHPRLNIVKHSDYIPQDYLPTFSSHTIEWNLHRIVDLSEQFILCNDDMFFLRPMAGTDYFREGLPCDVLHICPVTESRAKTFNHLLLNNMVVLNKHFDMHASAQEHPEHWFSGQYPEDIRKDNECALCWNRFPGLYYDHMPVPMLKSTIRELWETEGQMLDRVCRKPERDFFTDVNLFLVRFWNLARGRFIPYCRPKGIYCLVSDPDERIIEAVTGSSPLLCINEAGIDVDEDARRHLILSLLETRFPEQSSFELPDIRD